jgi:hypothetical protein
VTPMDDELELEEEPEEITMMGYEFYPSTDPAEERDAYQRAFYHCRDTSSQGDLGLESLGNHHHCFMDHCLIHVLSRKAEIICNLV